MNKYLVFKVLIVLSIVYGLGWALIGVLDLDGMTIPMTVGAIALGGAWALAAVFGKDKDSAERNTR